MFSRNKSWMKNISMVVLFFFAFQLIPMPALHAYDTGTGDMHGGTQPQDGKNPQSNGDKGKQETPPPPPKNSCETDKPVSLLTGEKTYTKSDFVIQGRGLSLAITHVYKSQRNFNGRWGYGWFLNYDAKIKRLENDNLLLVDETGRKNEYFKMGAGAYAPPAGFDDVMAENADGTYTRTLKNGVKYDFDLDGKLTSIKDNNGNSLTFAYESNEKSPINGTSKYFVTQETGVVAYDYKLTKVTDASGRAVTLSYNDDGRLKKMTDPTGREIQYEYDKNDNLVKITDPAGDAYAFKYEDENDVNNLTSVTDPEGVTFLNNTYDFQDRVVKEIHNGETLNFAYDVYEEGTYKKAATLTRSNGSVAYYEMSDCCGNPTKVVRDKGGLNLVTSYTYDNNMNMLSMTDPRGNTTSYTYDERGNILTVSDPEGNVTAFTYEPVFNQITSITDALGRATKLEYDGKGNLTRITDAMGNQTIFTYNADNGDLLTATDAEGHVTTFTYNDYGYISAIKDALNHTITMEYDSLGNLLSLVNRNGNKSLFSYDKKNQLTQVADALGNVTQFAYDKNGNRTKITDALNNATSFAYDDYNRIQAISNALNNATSFAYDVNSNVKKITDAEGNATAYEYDTWDRLAKIVDALGNSTGYAYDANGNLTSRTDAKGNTTRYEYDKLNRLSKTVYADGSTETYSYNQVGDLVSRTNREGKMIAYSYDKLNRLVNKSYSGTEKRSHLNPTQVIYQYDKLGRMISVSNDDSTSIYTYDSLGRAIQAVQDNKTVAYEYDAAGNRTKLVYPDGTYVTYLYDTLERLDQIKDASGKVLAEYSYDKTSRRTQLSLANGTQTNYQYDAIFRLTNLSNKVSSTQAIISNFAYGYDKIGNRTSMTTPKGIHSYSYDKIYQLTKADYPSSSSFSDTTYSFDAVANRTVAGSTAYVANELNQYSKVGGSSYAYDGNGNLTNDGKNTYLYDYENRLVQVKTASDTVMFKYDGFGRRTVKTSTGKTTAYLYDGDQILAEYDESGNLLRKFIYGTGIDEPIVMESAGKQYFYHADGLGSFTEITDSSGAVAEKYEYDVYGKPVIKDGSDKVLAQSALGNSYLFTGREYDADTGLYYYRARYYSPDLGRFLQTDPIGYVDSMNLYAYVGNNPLNSIDPFGLVLTEAATAAFTEADFVALSRLAAQLGTQKAIIEAVAAARIAAGAVVAAEVIVGVALGVAIVAGTYYLWNAVQNTQNTLRGTSNASGTNNRTCQIGSSIGSGGGGKGPPPKRPVDRFDRDDNDPNDSANKAKAENARAENARKKWWSENWWRYYGKGVPPGDPNFPFPNL